MSADVCEIWDQRAGTGDWHTGRDHSRFFRVIMPHNSDDDMAVSAAVGVHFADPYPSDPYALCKSVKATCRTGRNWIVQADYSTKFDFPEAAGGVPGSTPSNPASTPANPTDRAAVWSFGTTIKKKARFKDLDGNALVNVNNQALVPPWEEDVPLLNIRVTKFYLTTGLALTDFADFRHTCNSGTWHGLAAHTVLCDDTTAESATWENGFPVYRVTWSFIVDDIDGWRPTQILNAGTIERVSGKLKQITDEFTGLPITSPVCLLASGAKMPIGGTPYYLSFNLIDEIDFSSIPGPI